MRLHAFLDRDAADVAPALLGAKLLVGGVGGLIVETQAYHPSDPAARALPAPTPSVVRPATLAAAPPRARARCSPAPAASMFTDPTASTGASISSAATP